MKGYCKFAAMDAGVNWIAEGTETSLTAARVFDMLVCSAVNSTRLAKWQPPDSEGEVVVFGDADPAFEGRQRPAPSRIVLQPQYVKNT